MNDLPVMKWRAGWRGESRGGCSEVKEPLIVVGSLCATVYWNRSSRRGTVTCSPSQHWSWLIVSSHFLQPLRRSAVSVTRSCCYTLSLDLHKLSHSTKLLQLQLDLRRLLDGNLVLTAPCEWSLLL